MFGNRVVRGPDWSRKKDEDGGEGGVGTIVRSENSLEEVDQTVVVCWDTGLEDLYRTGPDGFCDLRVLDSAPTGVTFKDVWCDGCNNQPDIAGMRWHCVECAELNYDLCSLCYHGDKHDISHNFIRFDSPSHSGTSVGMRLAVARVQARGIYPGALVQCGRDWDQGPECDGSDGIVLELTTREDTARSSALVQWGIFQYYHRIGYDGKVDLKLKDCDSAQGPLYYREHLPTAMSPSKTDVVVQTVATIKAPVAEQLVTQKPTKDVSSASFVEKFDQFLETPLDTVVSNVVFPIFVKFHKGMGHLMSKGSRMIEERRNSLPDIEVQNKDNEEQELKEQAACSIASQQTSMSSISKHYTPDSKDVYKMKSSPRGLAVIINMKSFASHNEGNIVLEEREGCESDLQSLLTLMDFLNFEWKLFLDKGKEELLAACDEISKSDDRAKYDCFAMFIMTHGGKGNVFYASDGEKIEESFLVDMFGRCEALSGKPKLFFFQYCRGDQTDPGRYSHDGNSGKEDPEFANPQYTPDEGHIGPITSDILVSYSCYQGYKAYRNITSGSVFIQSLVEIFTSNAKNEDLKTMLTMVNKNVSKDGCQIGAIQMPVFTSTLRKQLYFWPGLIFET